MIVTLEGFAISDGVDRAARVVGERGMDMTQSTQEAVMVRAEWPTWFHSRAVRRYDFAFEVTFPSLASSEAAEEEAHDFCATLPKGGELVIVVDGTQTSYARAVVRSATVNTVGVRNSVMLQISAAEPTTTPTPTLVWDAEILTWED